MPNTRLIDSHRRKEVAPSTISVDFTDFTTARPADTAAGVGWLDTDANPTHILTTAGNFASQGWLNTDPIVTPAFAISGTGVDILLPGLYEGTVALELVSNVGTTEYGLGIVADGASPAVFYSDDGKDDASRIMILDESRTVVRNFLIDVLVPTTIQAVLVERGGVSGQLKTDGGQLTITRLAGYIPVSRA